MAVFEGTHWAQKQCLYLLKDKSFSILESNAKVYAVSRSVHYGMFLAFEGIRFYCQKDKNGQVEAVFLNLKKNLERFQRGISFNLSFQQQDLVPTLEEIESVFRRYFQDPSISSFLSDMVDLDAQGYLRPFTFDEAQSIGVNFPENPSIRAVVCRYDRYLGEPFSGVVIPDIVRAVGINGTGNLKLGVNYLMSIKAVDLAKQIYPEAGSALLLDDQPEKPLESRLITEWDSSCCLFALRDGTVIKIPESPLILPSVTIDGVCDILKDMGVRLEERDMTYGELIDRTKKDEMVVICSVGTAGILNRAEELVLVDESHQTITVQKADTSHEIYNKLGEAREHYWNIYKGEVPVPSGMEITRLKG